MAIIESASRDALFVITILRLIPRNKWISTTEIKQALEELGYSVEPRRLQRILRDIHKCDDLYVECNTSGKPYGYRRPTRIWQRTNCGLPRVSCFVWPKNTSNINCPALS